MKPTYRPLVADALALLLIAGGIALIIGFWMDLLG